MYRSVNCNSDGDSDVIAESERNQNIIFRRGIGSVNL
jgi:hypothetical protein